jgi:hypothetical protein
MFLEEPCEARIDLRKSTVRRIYGLTKGMRCLGNPERLTIIFGVVRETRRNPATVGCSVRERCAARAPPPSIPNGIGVI